MRRQCVPGSLSAQEREPGIEANVQGLIQGSLLRFLPRNFNIVYKYYKYKKQLQKLFIEVGMAVPNSM